MTRAVALLLGIVIGVLIGAAAVTIGWSLGRATAAVPSRPAPVVFAPLSPLPRDTGSEGGRSLPSVAPDAGQGDPSPVPTVTPAPSPTEPSMTPSSGSASLVTGLASWYSVGSGVYAAAGPALRVGDWRGRVVLVCRLSTCIELRLIDACQCYQGDPRERVIDLSRDAFARLAPPSRGLVEVTVSW